MLQSRDKPQNFGRKEAQEATQNFILWMMSSRGETTPSEHIRFLSLQIVQEQAKKDKRHVILPFLGTAGLIPHVKEIVIGPWVHPVALEGS